MTYTEFKFVDGSGHGMGIGVNTDAIGRKAAKPACGGGGL
jgi:hypothetical protein